MNKITALDIEIALANRFEYYRNVIVPNVSYGLHIHECDLLILSKNNYATEIEIKISKSDLRADSKKKHGHYSNKIKRLFFAVPENLKEDALKLIPERAGLFLVKDNNYVELIKNAKINKNARPLSNKEIIKLYQLASMRIWPLKTVVNNQCKNRKLLKETLKSVCPHNKEIIMNRCSICWTKINE